MRPYETPEYNALQLTKSMNNKSRTVLLGFKNVSVKKSPRKKIVFYAIPDRCTSVKHRRKHKQNRARTEKILKEQFIMFYPRFAQENSIHKYSAIGYAGKAGIKREWC